MIGSFIAIIATSIVAISQPAQEVKIDTTFKECVDRYNKAIESKDLVQIKLVEKICRLNNE